MAISDSNSTRCGRPAQLDVRIHRGQELVREICKVCWVHQVFDTLMNELSITERASQTCTCKLPSKVKDGQGLQWCRTSRCVRNGFEGERVPGFRLSDPDLGLGFYCRKPRCACVGLTILILCLSRSDIRGKNSILERPAPTSFAGELRFGIVASSSLIMTCMASSLSKSDVGQGLKCGFPVALLEWT